MGWINKAANFVKKKVLPVVHVALDVAGFIPGVGAVADLANAVIYLAEGDFVNAAISGVGAVPIIGDAVEAASKGAKVVSKGTKIAKGVKAVKTAKNAKKGAKGVKALSKLKKGKALRKAAKGKLKTGAKSLKKAKVPKKAIFKNAKKGTKKKICKKKCFTGDMLVRVENGHIPIKEIRSGMHVYSRNEITGETGLKEVGKISKTKAYTIYSVQVDYGIMVKSTAYHSFYVEEKGWVNAINLVKGDKLTTLDGTGIITSVSKVRYEESVEV